MPRLEHLLDVHSFFSFGAGASSPSRLVEQAKLMGYRHLALTDVGGVYGAVELHQAARRHGIEVSTGATAIVETELGRYPVPLIAENRRGYAQICELMTIQHGGVEIPGRGGESTGATGATSASNGSGAPRHPGGGSSAGSARGVHGVRAKNDADAGFVTIPMLEAHAEGVHALSGGRDGFLTRLLTARRYREARQLLETFKGIFPQRFWVQLYAARYPGDRKRGAYLRRLARDAHLPAVAAPEVRYATPELMPLYDALVCGRLGITVDTPHKERPQNDMQAIPDPEFRFERRLGEIPLLLPDVLENTALLAERTAFELLPDRLIPPRATLPDGRSAEEVLTERCFGALLERYRGEALSQARERLETELAVIRSVGFTEFFLVAAEVTDYCRRRGIVSSGRGSAAASIICYLLGITQADPIEHQLLFERFLHGGRRSPPDIDIDIASSRRDEVLAWVEERFGADTEAMVCNRITYFLPLAVQDLGRALGVPPEVRNTLSKALGRQYRHLRPHRAEEALEVFDEVLGDAPVKRTYLRLLRLMEPKFVRHVAPHSGGVVLARDPLTHYSPLERSTGGIKLLQFNKDDIEALGLIKLDLLGLRMLGAIERTREEVYRTEGTWIEVREPPLDERVFEDIRRGDTMGLFQVESPGQVRLSVQLQPETLTDLAHQVALFRPGPIQSQTVHPYIRRRQGLEPVKYLHDSLAPVLEKTYGVLLFQEDLMRIAVTVAGMDWTDAETFRKKVTTFEDEREIREWHRAFIDGARETSGCSTEEAQAIFDMMASFRGYGFAESHAWAFGLHAYTSAWLRYRYPAEYFASIMTEHPGMWSHSTLRQEAKRYDIGFGRLDVNRSGTTYRVEVEDDHKRLRPPLNAVTGVSLEAAQEVVIGRMRGGPYEGLRDVWERVRVRPEALEELARAGAFDRVQARRDALYEARALRHTQPPGEAPLFKLAPETPDLEPIDFAETSIWDYRTKGYSELGVHPVDLMRRTLLDLGATPMALLERDGWVRTGGLIVSKQKPGTAKGFAFFVLEDGPHRLQAVIRPSLWDETWTILRDAAMLVVEGKFERIHRAWTVRVDRLVGLDAPVRVKGYHYGGH